MSLMASQITSLTIVYSTVYPRADQRKHKSSASLALCEEFTGDRWIPRRWPVDSPHEWPVMWKMFPFDDVIMCQIILDISKSFCMNKWKNIQRGKDWYIKKILRRQVISSSGTQCHLSIQCTKENILSCYPRCNSTGLIEWMLKMVSSESNQQNCETKGCNSNWIFIRIDWHGLNLRLLGYSSRRLNERCHNWFPKSHDDKQATVKLKPVMLTHCNLTEIGLFESRVTLICDCVTIT